MSTVAAATALFTMAGVGTATADPMFQGGWQLSDNSGEFTYGDVYFYQRSVGISGTVGANVGECAQARFTIKWGPDADAQTSTTRTACSRDLGFSFNVDPNIVGGIEHVYVSLWTKFDTAGGTWTHRGTDDVQNLG